MSLIDINKKYTTQSGEPVHLYTINGKHKERPVVGEIEHATGASLSRWTKTGGYSLTNSTDFDLVEVKTKKKGWVVSYNYENYHGHFHRCCLDPQDTKKEALERFHLHQKYDSRITNPCAHEIEWEE